MAQIMVQYGRPSRSSERNLHGHPSAEMLCERQFEKVLLEHAWEKILVGNAYSCTERRAYSHLCKWMTSKWLERNKILIRCGRYSTKKSIWENQHHSLIMSTWLALRENAKQARMLLTIEEPCSNPESPQEEQKNYQVWELEKISTWSYDMEGHAKKCVERCELKKKRDSCTKSPLHALTSIQSIEIRWRIVRSAHIFLKC